METLTVRQLNALLAENTRARIAEENAALEAAARRSQMAALEGRNEA